ncbi:MAG TPA: LppX_LprAFG lipoprotein [Pseudonocardiaceae bacterium]|jgi:lipoprotein LprG|nr:LppX_LprAFG lipoprotein [Pseudonocardiaceae bacterium]
MPRRHLRLLALLAALTTALLASCGAPPAPQAPQDAPPALPDGARLLADSAQAMRTVTTTRVGITVQGALPGLPIQAAEGQLTRQGSAKGTATVDQLGQVVELDFVIIKDKLYVRGPTGGFQELPAATTGVVYDPSVILDPDRGIAAVLAGGAAATTEAREQVTGVDCYRVRASFSGRALGKLVPGLSQDSTGRMWIATDGLRLVQAHFPTPTGGLTFQFSDFDAPVDITPPG